jgi:hypothetical protein
LFWQAEVEADIAWKVYCSPIALEEVITVIGVEFDAIAGVASCKMESL